MNHSQQTIRKASMNARSQNKDNFSEIKFSNFEERHCLKAFEFQQQFMIDRLLIKLTQSENIGSIVELFIPLGNLKIKIHIRNKVDNVFRDLYNFVVP